MIRKFGLSQTGITRVFFSIYITHFGMPLHYLLCKEIVYSLTGPGNGMIHFFDMHIECVAYDFSNRKSHNAVGGGRQHRPFHHGITIKVVQNSFYL